MQVKISPPLVERLEGVRQALGYKTLSEATNLLLDSIRHQWGLSIAHQAKSLTKLQRIKLCDRHLAWLTKYATDRNISVSAVINLLLSEYFLGSPITVIAETPKTLTKPPEDLSEPIQDRPKGGALMKGLRLNK